ncbi:MAG: class I SAM-dependent methyltransferase [bacterium]
MPTKGYKGIGMEGSVARYYDRVARKPAMRGQYNAWAGKLTPVLQRGCSILEVAPGPGYLSIELSRLGFQVTGLDISQTLVGIASANPGKRRSL